ncbi:MAG: DUF6465 family protein [Lachnospiraceae bacterium]
MATTKKTSASKKADEVKVEVKAAPKAEVKEAPKAEVKTAAPAKKAPAKKAPAKKAEVKKAVYLQYAGLEKSVDELVKEAVAAAKVEVKDVTVYVKPEEKAAYYVINGGEETGKVEF